MGQLSRVLVTLIGCAVVSLAASDVRPQDSGDWTVWMGPQIFLSKPLGEFETSNPRLAFGGGFTAALIRNDSHFGARFDMGLAAHGRQSSDVMAEDVYGDTIAVNLVTSSRLSWGMFGVEWDQNPRGNGVYAFAMIGAEGVRTNTDVALAAASDPPGRPASNRGFAWSAGIGSRFRPPNSQTLAIVTELEYRRRGAADYVGTPAFETDASGTRYHTAHGDISTVALRVGIAFTKFE